MSCDVAVRDAVLAEVTNHGGLSGDSIAELKRGTDLEQFRDKQIRRAIESAHYGHGVVDLRRPRQDEFTRGWLVTPVRT